MNPFDICAPCIKITKSELLFEQYRMALSRGNYDIEDQNYDAIKCNQIWFDFIQWMFNRLDELYLRERYLLIDTMMKDQLRNQSAAEFGKLNREKEQEKNKRKVHLSLLQKIFVLYIRQPEQVEQQVTPPIQIIMLKEHTGVKQAVAKNNILEWVSVGEKVMLRL